MSKHRLIGPFFFQEDTVFAKNYLEMLQGFFIPEIRKLHKVRSAVFQQDGAPAHFSLDVRHYLNNQFPDRWIGRGGPIRWAPRSPDLTPLDFYLWGHLKNNVYKSPIKNLDELKIRIDNEVRSISKRTLSDVFFLIENNFLNAIITDAQLANTEFLRVLQYVEILEQLIQSD